MKYSEAVARRCSIKKVFWKISQNSQEDTCARVSFLIKMQVKPATLLKKILWLRCFPVDFAKFLRTPFFIEHLRWLLLNIPFMQHAMNISFHCFLHVCITFSFVEVKDLSIFKLSPTKCDNGSPNLSLWQDKSYAVKRESKFLKHFGS